MTSISLPGASGRFFVRSLFTCWPCAAAARLKVKMSAGRTELLHVTHRLWSLGMTCCDDSNPIRVRARQSRLGHENRPRNSESARPEWHALRWQPRWPQTLRIQSFRLLAVTNTLGTTGTLTPRSLNAMRMRAAWMASTHAIPASSSLSAGDFNCMVSDTYPCLLYT